MATMVQVAAMAGVSISTVSHVINGTRKVEPDTRKKVLDAIAATGYRQDALARAMRRSRSDSIGIVVSDAGEPAFADMVHGVEHAAAERGLTLLLANSSEDAEREERAIHALLDRRVDGLILARAATSRPDIVRVLATTGSPTVLLDRVYPDLDFDQVAADNRDSMRRLVAHLASHGHRRFCLIAGDIRVPALRERRDGFRDAVRDAQLADADQVVIAGEDNDDIAVAFRESLARGEPADRVGAVIAASTPLAALALTALSEAGLSTPKDIAFATFDGFNYPELFEPSLTTVVQPAFEMGVAAVGLLADRIEDPDSPSRTVRLHQTIALRKSTEAFVV
jgi:LacI family transcriptional regulator